MASLDQPNYLGDWLKAEFEPPNYCREEITVKSGQNLVSGQVVAVDTGEYVAFEDDTATPAAGILINAVDATSAAKPGVILKRGPAIVSKAGLTWHTDNDDTDKANGLADLLALGIVAREGV